MNIKIIILFGMVGIFFMLLAVIAHEADLSRNFNKTGDAKAFFFPITVENYNKSLHSDAKAWVCVHCGTANKSHLFNCKTCCSQRR